MTGRFLKLEVYISVMEKPDFTPNPLYDDSHLVEISFDDSPQIENGAYR